MTTRQLRRQIILELIGRNKITSQEQLQELLLVESVSATQATISRDLRDLGVVKTPAGYAVVAIEDVANTDVRDLQRSLRLNVQSLERAANMLVLKTNFGVARSLSHKLDQSNLPQIAGTMASDDTIFVATRSSGQAGELKRVLEKLAR